MDARNTERGPGVAIAGRRILTAAVSVALPALLAVADDGPADGTEPVVSFAAHEALPEGRPEELAGLYYAASEVPGIAALGDGHRRSLLDAVTQRYKNRLADRGAGRRRQEPAGRTRRSR